MDDVPARIGEAPKNFCPVEQRIRASQEAVRAAMRNGIRTDWFNPSTKMTRPKRGGCIVVHWKRAFDEQHVAWLKD